jgi:hypothetical protein
MCGKLNNMFMYMTVRLYRERTKGEVNDNWTVNVEQGYTVGCGFEPTDKVDPVSKIPCAGQTLKIYFTVNGKKVYSFFCI